MPSTRNPSAIATSVRPPKHPMLPSQLAQQEVIKVLLKECWNNKDNQIVLEDVQRDLFEILIDYVYTGSLPEYFSKAYLAGTRYGMIDLIRLYGLTDRFMLVKMKNDIVDLEFRALVEGDCAWDFQGLLDVFEAELSSTPLYQLALMSSVRLFLKTSDKEVRQHMEDTMAALVKYPDLSHDVLKAISQFVKKPWPAVAKSHPCDFHDHSEGDECEGGWVLEQGKEAYITIANGRKRIKLS